MFLLSSCVQDRVIQPKDYAMHRFPPLPEEIRIIAKPVPLPSLPWAEVALFGILALILAVA